MRKKITLTLSGIMAAAGLLAVTATGDTDGAQLAAFIIGFALLGLSYALARPYIQEDKA